MRPIVIAAGGTGGHFFPAEALASVLIGQGHRVVLMTDSRAGFVSKGIFAGREQYIIQGAGLAGRGVVRMAAGLSSLAAGVLQARALLRRLQPSVIVGFGGYPSVPPIVAARSLRRRPSVILHEQNAILGRANRFLARFADVLALGFAETGNVPAGITRIVTGNPVRPSIRALQGQGYEPASAEFRLLVLGGSLGARIFSDVVPQAVALLPAERRASLRLAQQCRSEDLARVRAAYEASLVASETSVFFDDIPARLAAAHFVIARAGASTCAELAVAGRPALLVPLPGAIDDHQTANAEALASAGAEVCAQAAFTPEFLATLLQNAMNSPTNLAADAATMSSGARPNAATDLARIVERRIAMTEAVS